MIANPENVIRIPQKLKGNGIQLKSGVRKQKKTIRKIEIKTKTGGIKIFFIMTNYIRNSIVVTACSVCFFKMNSSGMPEL